MTPQYIQDIERLAGQFPQRNVTLYFPDFDNEPPPDSLNQVFGAPVGVAADNWPVFPKLAKLLREMSGEDGDIGDDLRMEHVFSVDLRGLTGLDVPHGARVMQLYISNAGYNEAWSPGNNHTRVAFLSEADVAAGPFAGDIPARSQERRVRRFSLVPIAVPREVFNKPEQGSPLAALRDAIWKAPARLGGEPIWLQGDPDDDMDYGGDGEEDEDEGEDSDGDGDGDEDSDGDDDSDGDEGGDDDSDDDDGAKSRAKPRAATRPLGMPAFGGFVMQFDENFADVNLGDCGVMYVTGGDAHFQCY